MIERQFGGVLRVSTWLDTGVILPSILIAGGNRR
jgi:hypothetical protein